MVTSDRILYLLHVNGWTEKELGWAVATQDQKQRNVDLQWKVSRWKLGKEKPSRAQAKRIEQLCYQTVLKSFESPNGFRYICNLGMGYGEHFKDREDDALARLRKALVRDCPFAPAGRLQIIVLTTILPDGVRAQCFSSDQDPAKCFLILVPDDEHWQTNVRDEIVAHVLPVTSLGFEVRED
jgi:hypothetical protein